MVFWQKNLSQKFAKFKKVYIKLTALQREHIFLINWQELQFDSKLSFRLQWLVLFNPALSITVSPQEGWKLTAGLTDDLQSTLHLIPTLSFLLLLSPSFSLSSPCITQPPPGRPGQGAGLGSQTQKTKHSLPFEWPPPWPLSSRKSALCWARAVNKLLMRKQTSIIC